MNEDQIIADEPSTVASHTDSQEVSKPRKKIMSDAAIAANRANAKKCTGPKTRDGKFKSCLNAMKHGIYSNKFLLLTEDKEVFANVSASFVEEFKPTTPSELELLEQLITIAWRRRRVTELIQQRINSTIETVVQECAAQPEPRPTPAKISAMAFERIEQQTPSFARMEAYELRLCNLFHRVLNRFYAMRDKKISNETKLIRDRLSFAA